MTYQLVFFFQAVNVIEFQINGYGEVSSCFLNLHLNLSHKKIIIEGYISNQDKVTFEISQKLVNSPAFIV